eukprot:TRINITY_DN123056_c0_g1_i1.p1 TRINITY_DN123056_c0_g1~~TRINITY_DN123056_c0_g1_i1.p1  ORF type:complete len:355 (-),score=71.58 TRINITY_DN123056_c0_g1_i1:19-1083(-)
MSTLHADVKQTLETQHYACCCAWSPTAPDLLAYGTYECVDDAEQRQGELCLLDMAAEGDSSWKVALPGVYDIVWSGAHGATAPVCAAVLGSGEFVAFGCTAADSSGTLLDREPLVRQSVSPGVILTHLAELGQKGRFACSAQDGSVHLADLQAGQDHESETWAAHDAEVWFVEAAPGGEEALLLTGADDCMLKLWDLRAAPAAGPVAKNSKAHEAGVLAAAFRPADSNAFVTGSYDERLRLWDLRNLAHPVTTGSRCGDGTYRIRWDASGHIFVASMRAGVLICDGGVAGVADSGPSLEVLMRHGHGQGSDEAEEGIAYGLSVQPAAGCQSSSSFRVASASFYDKSIQVWTVSE